MICKPKIQNLPDIGITSAIKVCYQLKFHLVVMRKYGGNVNWDTSGRLQFIT